MPNQKRTLPIDRYLADCFEMDFFDKARRAIIGAAL
jgi:hypothetical protein